MMIFFIIDCPVWFKLVVLSIVFNFVGLNVFTIYFTGKMSHVSNRLHHFLHTIHVKLTCHRKFSSKQRLVSMKTNLNLMKMISSEREPFAFNFPDEQLITPSNAISWVHFISYFYGPQKRTSMELLSP